MTMPIRPLWTGSGLGREVVAVVDTRSNPSGDIVAAVKAMGIEVIAGHGLIEAQGSKRVKRAWLRLLMKRYPGHWCCSTFGL